jgi:hypothetical protein
MLFLIVFGKVHFLLPSQSEFAESDEREEGRYEPCDRPHFADGYAFSI